MMRINHGRLFIDLYLSTLFLNYTVKHKKKIRIDQNLHDKHLFYIYLDILKKMKRSRSEPQRPAKKQRLETRELINKLQDDDEDTEETRRTSDAKKAIDIDYNESRKKIRREFKTLNPNRVLPERRVILEQKLEFQEGLKRDRLAEIEEESKKRKQEISKRREKRSEKQEIDEKIEDYGDIAQHHCDEVTWKSIGKFKCVSKRLENIQEQMSDDQRKRYNEVLKELIKNGWRVKNKE